MNKKEASAIIDRLNRLYMMQMKKLSRDDIRIMVETWADTFRKTPYSTVLKAVNIYASRGKSFVPGVPDIIAEISRIEEKADFALFDALCTAVNTAAGNERRMVMTDPGGFRWSEEYNREIYYHPEFAWTTNYTASDFSELDPIIQLYAEDIEGLKRLKHEIDSRPDYARQRFIDSLPYLRAELKEAI